ncbi:phosphatidic acid phosphatase type 2/haloperoxidase [Mycotypha africana]|uniref:phosphatidic acid phosphatase type 2/haloperoxidase n=1 Tax=Mycotypha africana TaxID=64632 RepID=UPI00230190EF|nr:phosphatidic acid phosphatase type 2/haloperoxidase [Mycotypha africana]KAI8967606.1 phosphatidic acid phosphatase type 2/haloperoxidase [Mycotypha africana]
MLRLVRPTDSLKKRLIISYGKDWVLVIIMIIIFFAIDSVDPHHREFSIHDEALMHYYTVNETVPVWALVMIAIVAPIVIIAIVALAVRRSFLDFHSALLGLALSLSLTIMITDVIKVTVGRPRPDMLDRCQPPPNIENPPLHLLNYTICTEDHTTYKFRDGFKSFPSGHSSFSFAGMGYLSFYLAGKMHLFDEGGHTYKGFVFSFPFLAALLVAISRLHDYRHHWTDVFAGAIIGTVFAYFAYRQYYPSLADVQCHKPFPLRIKAPENLFPNDSTHNHEDLEAGLSRPYSDYSDQLHISNTSFTSTSTSPEHFDYPQSHTTYNTSIKTGDEPLPHKLNAKHREDVSVSKPTNTLHPSNSRRSHT